MPRLLLALHAGQPKTGTGAIQHWILSNEAQFESHGWRYMHAARSTTGGFSHRGLHVSLSPTRSSDPDWRPWEVLESSIQRELAGWRGAGVIASQETIVELPSERAARIVSAFAINGVEIRLIVYVRNPITQLDSRYRQEVKGTNLAIDFDRWVRRRRYLQPARQLEELKSFLRPGVDELIVRTYDPMGLRKSLILSDFATSLAIPVDVDATVKPEKRINASLDDETVLFKRELNRHVGGDARFLGRRLARWSSARGGKRSLLFSTELWNEVGYLLQEQIRILVGDFGVDPNAMAIPALGDIPRISKRRGRELLEELRAFDREAALRIERSLPIGHDWLP